MKLRLSAKVNEILISQKIPLVRYSKTVIYFEIILFILVLLLPPNGKDSKKVKEDYANINSMSDDVSAERFQAVEKF